MLDAAGHSIFHFLALDLRINNSISLEASVRNGNKRQLERFVHSKIRSAVLDVLDFSGEYSLRTQEAAKYSLNQGFLYQVDNFVLSTAASSNALRDFQKQYGSDAILDTIYNHSQYMKFLNEREVSAKKRGDLPHFQEHAYANLQKRRYLENLVSSSGHSSYENFTDSDFSRIAQLFTDEMWENCLMVWVTRDEERILGRAYRGDGGLRDSLQWYSKLGVQVFERATDGNIKKLC